MRVYKILFGTFLIGLLAASMVLSGITQQMRGSVKRIGFDDIFGPNCDGTTGADCTLRYEYWSDVASGEINRGANLTGVPFYTLRAGGSRRSDYLAGLGNIGDFPKSGTAGGNNWFLAFFGELNGDSADHIGYYAVESQIVGSALDPFEFGNWNRFDCIGSFPVACFSPTGPPPAPSPNNVAHSVFRANGTEVRFIGGLSPIPIPRASIDVANLLINVEWDAATGQLPTDGAPDPIVGYRVYIFEDTDGDQILTGSVAADMRPLADVPVGTTNLAVSLVEDIDILTNGAFFALQLLYVSTPSVFDAFERRSGFTVPNTAGNRVEGLSANSNAVNVGLVRVIQNFLGFRGLGNENELRWEVPNAADFDGVIENFEVLVFKSAEGISGDNEGIPDVLADQILGPFPFDTAVTSYEAVDNNAGRTGSKINIYILRANIFPEILTPDAGAILSRPIVVVHH